MMKSWMALCTCCLLLPAVRADSVDEAGRRLARTYADIVFAIYSDALQGAQELEAKVQAFVETPTPEALAACRAAWTQARRPYLATECFRYYGGPIDNATGPEGLLNAWPVDETWLESGSAERPGLIENSARHPQITPGLLRSLNQKEGEKNVSTGWHGIEFLLWGADRSAKGPGSRPYTDFSAGSLAQRRCAALTAMCELLVQNLQTLADAWEPHEQGGNYRAEFLDTTGIESTRRILTGLIFLSGQELAGERMNVALEMRDQEEEHSCFSDTTTQDIEWDIKGIRAVWDGTWRCIFRAEGDVAGEGLKKLAAVVNPALAASIEQALTRSTLMARTIPHPFDQAILGEDDAAGRRAIIETMEALEFLSAQLKALADKLEVEISNQSAFPAG